MFFWFTIGYLFVACLVILIAEPIFKKVTPQTATFNTLLYAVAWLPLLGVILCQIVFAIMVGLLKVILFLFGIKQ